MATSKFTAGDPFPAMAWPKVGGGVLKLTDLTGWRLLVVYRGKHCPLCRKYLNTLNELLPKFLESGVQVAAVSADSRDKAETESREEGWQFPVAYDLSVDAMRELGLYVSNPTSPKETDRPFAEPGLFVVNPPWPDAGRQCVERSFRAARAVGRARGREDRAERAFADSRHGVTSRAGVTAGWRPTRMAGWHRPRTSRERGGRSNRCWKPASARPRRCPPRPAPPTHA